MRLEKREITLNEKDSLQDAYMMQKTLLLTYLLAMDKASRKETRKQLLSLLNETGEDLFL